MRANVNGVKVFVSPFIADRWYLKQFRYPRSKKIRIIEKWAKNEKNKRMSLEPSFLIDKNTGDVFCGKASFKLMEKYIKNII